MLMAHRQKLKILNLGDQTKGGEVLDGDSNLKRQMIYNYKGVTVAGSHEDDPKFIMVG